MGSLGTSKRERAAGADDRDGALLRNKYVSSAANIFNKLHFQERGTRRYDTSSGL